MSDINILPNLIPVCPDCHRVMLRREWDARRPHATCHPCGKAYYYAEDGRIVLAAKLRSAA